MDSPLQASIPCNLCGGTAVSRLSGRSRSGQPLRTVACRACGLVWSDPRPHDARQFYEDDYRVAYKQTFEPRPKHVLRAGRVALDRLGKMRHLLQRPGMRVLDIGSGGGEFAYLLRSLGHAVRGIEPNRGYAGYAAREYGLDIERGFVGDVALEAGGWDLITIWHVLEHTENPGAVLAQLRRALRPGGALVVEVPNVEATCQSPASSFHEAHLYNFNAATLQALAAREGLQARSHQLSADGGNLTCVFGPAEPQAVDAGALAGNHDRIAAIVRGHTPLAHALSGRPLARALRRLAGQVGERVALARARQGGTVVSGRPLLDRLYRPTVLAASQPPGGGAQGAAAGTSPRPSLS